MVISSGVESFILYITFLNEEAAHFPFPSPMCQHFTSPALAITLPSNSHPTLYSVVMIVVVVVVRLWYLREFKRSKQ